MVFPEPLSWQDYEDIHESDVWNRLNELGKGYQVRLIQATSGLALQFIPPSPELAYFTLELKGGVDRAMKTLLDNGLAEEVRKDGLSHYVITKKGRDLLRDIENDISKKPEDERPLAGQAILRARINPQRP